MRANGTLTLSWQVVHSHVITYDCGHVAAQPPHPSPSSPLICRVDSTFGINNEGTKTKGEEQAYAYLLNWKHRKQGTPCTARANAISRLKRERNHRSTYAMETFPCKNPEKLVLHLTGESFPAHKQGLSKVMGNKDGWICSCKSRQSVVSCSQADPCQLLSFLPPSSLILLPQVGKAGIRNFPNPVALPCLSLPFNFGGHGNESWRGGVTHRPYSRMYPLSHGENTPTAAETLCWGFHCKTVLENHSGKYDIFLVMCSQWYEASLMPTCESFQSFAHGCLTEFSTTQPRFAYWN